MKLLNVRLGENLTSAAKAEKSRILIRRHKCLLHPVTHGNSVSYGLR